MLYSRGAVNEATKKARTGGVSTKAKKRIGQRGGQTPKGGGEQG